MRFEFKVSVESRIEKARQIVANHQAGMIDGFWVDATTAHMLCTVHDALNDDNKAAFERVNFLALIDFGWKNVTAKGGS